MSKKTTQTTHNLTKKQKDFLVIFENKLCIVSPSCRAAKIGRKTFYDWCEKNPTFKQAVEDTKVNQKDFGENALLSLVQKGNPAATIFYNKCKNKDRGYVERTEVEQVGEVKDQKLELVIIDSPEDLKKFEDEKEDENNS
jgi:hypothetical protein